MIYLIGSRALDFLGKGYRSPKDWDLMCSPEELEFLKESFRDKPGYMTLESHKYPGKHYIGFTENETPVSMEVDATQNQSRLYLTDPKNFKHFGYTTTTVFGVPVYVPHIETLWVLKRSHANFGVHIDKTLSDIIYLSETIVGTEEKPLDYSSFLTPEQITLLGYLKEEAAERNRLRNSRISFDRPYSEFFNPKVRREYVHDDLHNATCFYDKPLFRKCLRDPEKALVDMEKFSCMPFEDQLIMGQEEAIAIGIERYGYKSEPQSIYRRGMTKVIRDLSKGRYQDFLIDHIHLMRTPKWDFMAKFNEAVESGKLVKHD